MYAIQTTFRHDCYKGSLLAAQGHECTDLRIIVTLGRGRAQTKAKSLKHRRLESGQKDRAIG